MKKLTHEEVQERISNKYPNLSMIEEFQNTRTKVVVKCSQCNIEQKVNLKNLLERDFECPGCACRLGSVESYLKLMREIHPNILVKGNYVNNRTKVDCECLICGHLWRPTPNGSVHQRQGCPRCAGKLQYTLESFKKKVREIHPTLTVLSEAYVNNKTPIQLKCNSCGGSYEQRPCDVINKEYGCPTCSISKGEKKIEQFLKRTGIIYTREATFPGLLGVGGNPLRFDFYLPGLNMLVEFDGNQHMYYSEMFHKSRDFFERQQEHDKRKNEFCQTNNINLIRIPYSSLNRVEELMKEGIEQLK